MSCRWIRTGALRGVTSGHTPHRCLRAYIKSLTNKTHVSQAIDVEMKLTMYVYYYRTYEKAVSGGGEREKGGRGARLVRSSQATSHY